MVVDIPESQIFTVTQLTHLVKSHLEDRFPDVWVEGEVSNLRTPASGHLYLTLKDQESQIRAVIFRSSGRQLRFIPKDGQKILCRGHLTVYELRGDYQLVIEYLEPTGIGSLQLAFEQLKEKLSAEGLFDPAHKKPLPLLPRCIGVVTSPTGAAIRDILKVLHRRFANLRILINPVPVQGEGASVEIARALEELNKRGDVDVIIVGRGGGSLEDLWAFNEEIVARAIYRSTIPVISAVGHETDYTIADFVADLRAPTPSAAAEIVVRSKEELTEKVGFLKVRLRQEIRALLEKLFRRVKEEKRVLQDPTPIIQRFQFRIDDLSIRLQNHVAYLLRHSQERLRSVQKGLSYNDPRERIVQRKALLSHHAQGLYTQMAFILREKKHAWEAALARLDILSPLSTLKRGYSIARKVPSQQIVREAREVTRGERISLQLHKGTLICGVEEIQKELYGGREEV